MRDAYRDDVAAAELRVGDLEREHADLQRRHAELRALAARPAAPIDKRKKPMLVIALALAAMFALGVVVNSGLVLACAATALFTQGRLALAFWGGKKIW